VTDPAPRRSLHWDYLGRVPYAEAVELQLAARAALKSGEGKSGEGPERFFLLEHPHVYTLGRNASGEDVLESPEWLAARGVEIAECDRGGQVTYHGPGQLVGYPVVNLSPDRRDIRRYVRDLQEVLIRTLADYGVTGRPGEEAAFIGVWAGDEKIASIGVHLSRWITTHGFALNVSTDLSYFAGIIPCGLQQVRMTSIERLTGRAPELSEIAAVSARHFGEVFDRELVAAVPSVLLVGER
jgi:lipoyl(octanoyl) transferase